MPSPRWSSYDSGCIGYRGGKALARAEDLAVRGDPDSVVPCSAALTGPWQQGTTEYLTLSALCCLSFLAVLKCFHENRIWSTVSDPSLLTCRWILNRSSYLALHVWTMAVHWVKINITTIKNPFFAFLPRELSCYIAVLLTFPLLKSLIYK